MGERFLIGELAERTGRGIHAIRWYEAQGLIPGVVRDPGGRRLYGPLHIRWLELIERLRHTGMSIAQMRAYTALVKQGNATLRQRRALLEAHRARVEATIAEWTIALRLLDDKIDFYGAWVTTGVRPRTEPRVAARAKQRRSPRRQP